MMISDLGIKAVGVAAGLGCAMTICGVQPNSTEKAMARRWLQDHLLNSSRPVFSFVYDHVPFDESDNLWQRTTHREKGADGRRITTTTFLDPKTKLAVQCVVTEFPGSSAVDWLLRLENKSSEPTPIIENLRPLDVAVDAPAREALCLTSSPGDRNSGASFAPHDERIPLGEERTFDAPGGCSSKANLPFFNLALPNRGIAIAVGWSGRWQASFGRTLDGAVTVKVGQEGTHFRLLPGESVRTPRILLVHWAGGEPLRGSNLMRQVMLERYWPKRDGKPVVSPVCATVNWTAPDGTYEGPHLAALPQYAKVGVEVFWSDMDPQHWYPGGFPGGTGNWTPDPALYPHGLEPIGDAVKKAGLEYLLWFEPERAQMGTQVEREHAEYVHTLPGNGTTLFKMDMPEAQHWMFQLLDSYVKKLHLSWIRWDFNMNPLDYWAASDAPDRQGVTEMKYIEGLYALWDQLRAANPGLVIDQCAGGGRRIDLEVLTRGVPLWHSDMMCFGPNSSAAQLQNGGLFRWVPFHGCGDFDLEPSYGFRSAMTSGNILCAGDAQGLSTARPESGEAMKRTVAIYKKVRPFMMGDFYPLFPHVEADDVWYGYQFDNPKLGGGFALVFRRPLCRDARTTIRLRGVDPRALYVVENQDTQESERLRGRQLQNYTVEIGEKPGSALIFYSKAK